MRLVTLNLSFKQTEATDPIRAYAEEKIVPTIQKFAHHDTEAHMVLKVEKLRHLAEISFHVDGHDFACHSESDDMYTSIDRLNSTLAEQLRRHKDKLTRH